MDKELIRKYTNNKMQIISNQCNRRVIKVYKNKC